MSEQSDLLKQWLRFGWKFRGLNRLPRKQQREYVARMNYELELIESKDFTSYFLVMSDIIRWAKDNKIPVGPARGSSAGSLVCYLLRITEVNPMNFPSMLFERFIDPSRTDLPDIDTDISDDRRKEVFDYAAQKYGEDRVANIANFTRYRGKNSLDDVARVYRIPKWETDIVKELITDRPDDDPRQFETLADTFETYPQAAEVLKRRPVLKYAVNLEGNYRNMGVHAAGIAMSEDPLDHTCPIYQKTNASGETIRVIAYDKWDSEYVGILKADFLGLSTMGMIGIALEQIGMDLEELYKIPLDDPKTLRAFRQGDLTGIFQFEGRTTRNICAEVEPETFAHLADITSLSRPGPLFSGIKTRYVKARHDPNEIQHYHPVIDEITKNTYGELVYQEQVLATIRDLGGFDGAEINGIRKKIGKKLSPVDFQKIYEPFEEGARRLHNMKPEQARKIWHMMENSSKYLFNYSHAVSYTHISFFAQWLKQNHPTAFYVGQFSKVGDGKDKLERRERLMLDALRGWGKRRAPQTILPPDILSSEANWTTRYQPPNTIRAGFLQIPGVGLKTAQSIVEWRDDKVMSIPSHEAVAELGLTWADMVPAPAQGGVKGIGQKTVEGMLRFVNNDDPFALERTADLFRRLRTEVLVRGNNLRIPVPTHTAVTMPKDRDQDGIVWAGVVKKRVYRDYIEDQRNRGKTRDEVLANMKDPHLTKSCTLYSYDDTDELSVKFNRWEFAKHKEAIEGIEVGVDVVVIIGKRLKDFGTSLHAKGIYVLNLEDDEELEEVDS